jgi:hypothetical protein
VRRALAVRLLKAGGAGTPDDVAAVLTELARMPLAELQQMKHNRTKVVACRESVTDYLTDLKGVTPRGWPPGSTWDSVPGLFSPEKNEVVIATRAASATDSARRVPVSGEGHGSVNMVLHECGHSLDAFGHFSASDPAFRADYAADLPTLPPYFAQPGIAGPQESFAETLALAATGTPGGATFPHLMEFWASHDPFGGPPT